MTTSPQDEGAEGEAGETQRVASGQGRLSVRLESWRKSHDLDHLRQLARRNRAQSWVCLFDLPLQTITPIYGGGPMAGQADLLVPFRARAIRNGIRHWWWLSNRRRKELQGDEGQQRMFDEMTALWGGPGDDEDLRASQVHVFVEGSDIPAQVAERWYTYLPYRQDGQGLAKPMNPGEDPWQYALFGAMGKLASVTFAQFERGCTSYANGPLRGKRRLLPDHVAQLFPLRPGRADDDGAPSLPATMIAPGLRMRLRIEVSKPVADDVQRMKRVELALALWLTWGGIGGRTSRGLGKFWVADGASQAEDERWSKLYSLSNPRPGAGGIPSVGGEVVTSTRPEHGHSQAEQAAASLLDLYRRFRQARPPRNPPQRPRPGRSFWPEPDVVRRRFKASDPVHLPRIPPAYEFLPRLRFGAPIVIDFGKAIGNGIREPKKTTLSLALHKPHPGGEYVEFERYPSPLCFSVFRLANGRWLPAVLSMDPAFDLGHPELNASMKNADEDPVLIPLGKWWPNRAAATFEQQKKDLLDHLRGVPSGPNTQDPATLPLRRFLDLVREG